ncbi:MAG: SpoIIE family protein phosphatase [Ignavibacteriaceae bacterium]|nr:SpoIIE family protein phosphatase [Ignavibacteriaceae bacterium]
MKNKLKEIYFRNRKTLISVLSVTLIVIAIINIYFVLEVRVTSNDECLWNPEKVSKDSTGLVFRIVKVKGVTWNAGIRDGDVLLSINGVQAKSANIAQVTLNNVKSGDYADYVVQKLDGRIVQTKVYVKKLIKFGDLAGTLTALIWILVGFVVLTAKPDGKIQKLFYLIGVAAVLGNMGSIFPDFYLEYTQSERAIYPIIAFFWALGVAYAPFIVVYFFWRFPYPFRFTENKWLKRFFFFSPLVIFLFIFTVITLYFGFQSVDRSVYFFALGIIGLLSAIANVTAWISLMIHYFRIKDKIDRKPILIILLTFTLGILASVYTSFIAPLITDTVFNSPEFYTPIILVVLVPISFAYSIFKYQLMDVSVVLRNAITYASATVALAAIYFLIIYVLGQTISEAIGTEYRGVIAGIVFILFAIVFQSTKDKFQDFLTEKFYPEQFAYQKVLLKFSKEIASLVGHEKILDSITDTFVSSLQSKKFGLMVRDEKKDSLILVRKVGFIRENIEITKSDIISVIDQKTIMKLNPVIDQNDFLTVFPIEGSLLIDEQIFTVVPMVVKSKVIGLLLFGLKHSGSQFAGKDLDLLVGVANQAAVSIENARLYESEAHKLKIERDLDLARKIQQGLLPKCIPQMNGLDICGQMIPAMQVGGDYFDLIQVSPSKIFIAVGDVSGKGLAASLYMTKLQTMMQLTCKETITPKQVLIEVNKKLFETLDRSSFITMTLALFDTDTRTVKICRAGHMPLITSKNGSIESLVTGGIGLGMEKGEIFERTLDEYEIKFTHNQLFAFFSDGITEAMNEKRELYGEERLVSIFNSQKELQSSELMDKIWQSLDSFRGKAQPNDDMTMVIVKVK